MNLKIKTRIAQRLKESLHPSTLLASTGIALVIAGYIWFISFGHWTSWRNTTDFYDQQASAFAHGSLSLEKEVNPALLALKNPYNPNEREAVDYPLDFSLYDGKYYLYFGPVPALLLVTPKLFGAGTIGDQYLVFIFVTGIFIFQSLLIIEIRRQFFPQIPGWMPAVCVLFCGLIAPTGWILTEARVYEAAVASGQFFFLAGFYFNLKVLNNRASLPGQFLLGSILWAFSVGSRLPLALPIGFMCLLITFQCLREAAKTKSFSEAISSILSLGLPLAMGMAILGWYNWARFGSVLETGWYYQLSTPDLQRYSGKLFSKLYILPNIYEYFAARPKLLEVFPFLQPIRRRGYLLFPFLDLPNIYHTRAMTGIFFSAPFLVFAGLPVISFLFPKAVVKSGVIPENKSGFLRWLVVALLGSFLCGAATIVSYFWVVTRYFFDFSPALILLSTIGFWMGYDFLSRWNFVRKSYAFTGVALIIISIVTSSLLVLSIRTPQYQAWNPELWNRLSSFFAW